MSSDIFYDPQIFTKSYEEALKQNEKTLSKIRNFKKELEDVKINLEQNQNYLHRNIMVPIGSKALMKGKLVHTNEVTINIGDKWFIKKSAAGGIQTCNRMIERCNLNLAEYEKEMNLLCSNLEVPNDYEIFASGDVQDIVEPYDEEEEKKWLDQHREKVRQYKKELALKKENEENLFKRLDKLEEEEKEETAEEENKNDDDEENEDEEEDDDDDDEDSYFDDEDIDEEEYNKNIINFKHSQIPSKNTEIARSEGTINTPSDIYKKYLLDSDSIVRKSILKKDNYVTQNNVAVLEERLSKSVTFSDIDVSHQNNSVNVQSSSKKLLQTSTDAKAGLSFDEMSIDEVFGDIVEKTPSIVPKTENNPTRRVSKFKQSRMK